MVFARYGDSHVKDKMVSRPFHTGNTTSLYWDSPQRAKNFISIIIKRRSSTKVSDRWLIDVNLRFFVIWVYVCKLNCIVVVALPYTINYLTCLALSPALLVSKLVFGIFYQQVVWLTGFHRHISLCGAIPNRGKARNCIKMHIICIAVWNMVDTKITASNPHDCTNKMMT